MVSSGGIKMKTNLMYVLILFIFLVPITVSAAEEQVVIDIQGMTCGLWPIAIEKSLAGVEGVSEVKISLKEEQGSLIAEDSVSDEELLKAITKAGPYKGKIVERKPPR